MNEYRRRSDGVLLSDLQLRQLYPNDALPAVFNAAKLAKMGFDPVLPAPRPNAANTQMVIRSGAVSKGNDVWVQGWDVVDLPPEDLQRKNALDITTMWDNIQEERSRRFGGGVKVGEYWYQTNPESLQRYQAMFSLGAQLPLNTINWKTMSGVKIFMTPALVGSIFLAIVVKVNDIQNAGEVHRIAMESSSDPLKYNYKTGWPEIYSEANIVTPT